METSSISIMAHAEEIDSKLVFNGHLLVGEVVGEDEIIINAV